LLSGFDETVPKPITDKTTLADAIHLLQQAACLLD